MRENEQQRNLKGLKKREE